jgi:hypothetical protein
MRRPSSRATQFWYLIACQNYTTILMEQLSGILFNFGTADAYNLGEVLEAGRRQRNMI